MDIMAYEMREDIFLRSTAIVARNDATALKQYLDGKDAAVEEHGEFAVSWHLKGFGNQRIMWATGEVGGSGECDAPLQYHGGARGLASLNFPGFGSACILEEEKEEEAGNGGHGRDVGINR